MLNGTKLQDDILQDIRDIQKCASDELFEKAMELFFSKYRQNINPNINDFLNYIDTEWVQKHPGWYEGFLGALSVSTNNGLEAVNGTIKTYTAFRQLMSLELFLSTSFDLVHNWSHLRDPANINCKQVHTSPTIELSDHTLAYNWNREKLMGKLDALSD